MKLRTATSQAFRNALIVTLVYAVFGICWIAFTDRLLDGMQLDPQQLSWQQTYKGWIYVFLTASLLFGMVFRIIRKQAVLDSALRTSEAHLSHMLRLSPAICYLMDTKGTEYRLRWVSESTHRVTGFTAAECLAPGWWDNSIHPNDKADAIKALEQAQRTGRAFCEYRLVTKADEYIWLRDELCTVDGPEPDVISVIGACIDITERRMAEDRYRLSNIVIENAHDGIMITDGSGAIISVNAAFTRITGYPEDEVLGKNPSILKSGHHDEGFYQRMWKSLRIKGHWQGEIMNKRKNGDSYIEWLSITQVQNDQGEPANYVAVFSDISRLKEAETQINDLINYDPLTRLPNRPLMVKKIGLAIEHAARDQTHMAVLCMDLDHFKVINEGYGHLTGDMVIANIADRIRKRLRSEDNAGRFAGDKFIIILEQLDKREHAAVVAQDILNMMADPIPLPDKKEVLLTTSIGITTYPEDGSDTDIMLRNADAAVNHAKLQGRNTFCFYTEQLTQQAARKLDTGERLRQALARNEMVLYYQPVVSVATNDVVGAEALIRWQPSENEVISPAEFIPLAEDTGLIIPIGEFVIEEAARQVREWLDAGVDPGAVAVNISAEQLKRQDLETVISSAVSRYQLEPSAIELELTESSLMSSGDSVLNLLQILRRTGCCLAIDDFGTGYSSLSYLKQFPIDKLKIDRSFIIDLKKDGRDFEIVHAIVAMAKAMKLSVQAEGVEHEEQLQILRELDCNTYQGYYFGRPVPADQFFETFLCKK